MRPSFAAGMALAMGLLTGVGVVVASDVAASVASRTVRYAWPLRVTDQPGTSVGPGTGRDSRPGVAHPVVTRPFEGPAAPWLAGHRGVDLLAAEGDEVLSPADGVVSFAGVVVDRPLVTITHPDGRRSTLEPVVPALETGATVRSGGVVGVLSAPTGHCGPSPITGEALSCLHWGVRVGTEYVDPESLIAVAPIVLLPRPLVASGGSGVGQGWGWMGQS